MTCAELKEEGKLKQQSQFVQTICPFAQIYDML